MGINKKFFVVAVMIVMAFTLAACGDVEYVNVTGVYVASTESKVKNKIHESSISSSTNPIYFSYIIDNSKDTFKVTATLTDSRGAVVETASGSEKQKDSLTLFYSNFDVVGWATPPAGDYRLTISVNNDDESDSDYCTFRIN